MQKRTEERTNKIKRVLQTKQPQITVVLENIHDPHNVSAILRSCDAVGVMEVQLIYTTQKFPRFGQKSSAGTRKWIVANRFESVDECYSYLKKEGYKIYTTNLVEDSVSLYDIDFSNKIALVFGNEHSGVSEEATNKSDGNFIIPQFGMAQSLNVSVSAAVSLYEALRQRQSMGKYKTMQLSDKKYKNLLNEWLDK